MVPKMPYPINMSGCAISQNFGEHPEDYAQFKLKGHNGLDLAPYGGYRGPGISVTATDKGTVKYVGDDKVGWGNHVDITHSWGMSRSAHLEDGSMVVRVGQVVSAGTVLGIMGSTGNSSGVHLHFGIYPIGVSSANGYSGAVDPLPYLSNVPIVPPITPPINPPGPVVVPPWPTKYVSTLKPGVAKVVAPSGLAVRLKPEKVGSPLAYLLFGNQIVITPDTVTTSDNITWRKVEAWVAEWDGTTQLIKN